MNFNSNDNVDDDVLVNYPLRHESVDNTIVHLLLLVMDTVAVQMYYIHSDDMDDNVVGENDDACL